MFMKAIGDETEDWLHEEADERHTSKDDTYFLSQKTQPLHVDRYEREKRSGCCKNKKEV